MAHYHSQGQEMAITFILSIEEYATILLMLLHYDLYPLSTVHSFNLCYLINNHYLYLNYPIYYYVIGYFTIYYLQYYSISIIFIFIIIWQQWSSPLITF